MGRCLNGPRQAFGCLVLGFLQAWGASSRICGRTMGPGMGCGEAWVCLLMIMTVTWIPLPRAELGGRDKVVAAAKEPSLRGSCGGASAEWGLEVRRPGQWGWGELSSVHSRECQSSCLPSPPRGSCRPKAHIRVDTVQTHLSMRNCNLLVCACQLWCSNYRFAAR